MKTNTTNSHIALGIGSLIALQLTAPLQAATQTYSTGSSFIGATVTGTANHSASNGICNVSLSGRADGQLFYKPVSLVSGESNLRLDGWTNRVTASGNLKAAGYTLTTWNKSLSGSGTFATFPLVSYLPGGTATFMVGPVPVTVQMGGSVIVYAEGVANMSVSNGKPVVDARFGPIADVGAFGSAGVGVAVASAGVEGSLRLCRLGLAGTVKTYPTNDGIYLQHAATFTRGELAGKLSAYAQIGYGWFSWRPTYTICSFNGSNKTTTLASANFKLR